MNKLNAASLDDVIEMQQILVSEKTDNNHLSDTKVLNILKKIGRYLFVDTHKQRQQIKSYNRLLKKIEDKEIALKKKLKDENIEKNREIIEMRLKIYSVQRSKAITAINILNNRI